MTHNEKTTRSIPKDQQQQTTYHLHVKQITG